MQDLIYYRSHKILLCLEIYSASLTTIYAVIYIHAHTHNSSSMVSDDDDDDDNMVLILTLKVWHLGNSIH